MSGLLFLVCGPGLAFRWSGQLQFNTNSIPSDQGTEKTNIYIYICIYIHTNIVIRYTYFTNSIQIEYQLLLLNVFLDTLVNSCILYRPRKKDTLVNRYKQLKIMSGFWFLVFGPGPAFRWSWHDWWLGTHHQSPPPERDYLIAGEKSSTRSFKWATPKRIGGRI